jgi:catechol 2,3-dioxygenase-like lactoylglutathione lyase family enzyme
MTRLFNTVTISADDLPAMVKFYVEKLGWRLVAGDASAAYFRLNGFLISIMQRQLLANFMGLNSPEKGKNSLVLGFNLDSPAEVISQYEIFRTKDIPIVKEPVEPGPGACFFYFADIEDNVFEVACNPSIILDERGLVMGYTYSENV